MPAKTRTPMIVYVTLLSLLPSSAEAKGDGVNYAGLPAPQLGYNAAVKDPGFSDVELAPKMPGGDRQLDLIARIQRTERWRNITQAAEKRYSLPQDLIYAVVINESLGDPLQPNEGNDGGLGLIHFQPSTARIYGLKVYQGANGVVNRSHGRSLRTLIEDKCKYDLPCVTRHDERAHPIKNIDALARYLKDGYNRTGTWYGAVQTINPNHRGYAARIYDFKKRAEKLRRKAKEDFNQRNKGKKVSGRNLTFDFYIRQSQRLNDNFGLPAYKKQGKFKPRRRP